MAPHRRNTTIATSVFYLLSLPFLILVCIGNTHINSTLNSIYFLKLDVSHIIPISVANSNLLNSVARSLGLHDFYTVGLWNYCAGYLGEGVTECSKPESFFWFNPVKVLVSELLAGATIALPSQVTTILNLLRIGSQVMFGFFLTGTVLNFVLMLLSPLAIYTRWFSLALSILSLISAILVGVAAVIATVISVAAKIALTAQDELNLSADIGIKMFVFMWLAAVFTFLAFILHAAMGCCCKPDRTSKAERREMAEASGSQKGGKYSLPNFVKRRRRGQAHTASPVSSQG
ncbi:SUR7/PalI family-domain-containing protein [Emericellopsis atlantica]|uniref:SUR7/PalI family-domain-containing protein n=1 Tax=Emericellopsis atlantica TaxID=2614577 RepID=A0A9P7ZFN0_9HYPO|nr:SUR7/PalI family-domain-containing protein [Emericellopsis atlantica]KAG9251229.1 SUR7/PalI family-domain-containing protein [Emericellopsis atlantica]